MNLNQILKDARLKSEMESLEFDSMRKRYIRESEELRLRFEKEILPHVRKASRNDYREWLKGFLLKGGEITTCYDRPFSDKFYIAKESFKMFPMFGSLSYSLIISADIKIEIEDRGHNDVYFMKDFKCMGSVPLYSDINFEENPNG